MTERASKAVFREMTVRERCLARALGDCRFPPASFAKRFAGDMVAQAKVMNEETGVIVGKITDRQSARLEIQCYIFRRQMPKELVPGSPPAGYVTPKMRAAAAPSPSAMAAHGAEEASVDRREVVVDRQSRDGAGAKTVNDVEDVAVEDSGNQQITRSINQPMPLLGPDEGPQSITPVDMAQMGLPL